MSIDPAEIKKRIRKMREDRLLGEDKTTPQDIEHNPEGSIMENESLPEYPFSDVSKQKKKEPKTPQPPVINP
jgi:hypothetical protein